MAQVERQPKDEAEAFGRARSHAYGQLKQNLQRAYPVPSEATEADQKFKLLLDAIRNCCPPDG